jgi:hypothetical protein
MARSPRNDEIFVTALAPAAWSVDNLNAFTVVGERVLTDVTTSGLP